MTIYIKKMGQGRPLVFLHGWGFDHTIWLSIAKILQKNYTLYLVDLPGFGESKLISWDLFKEILLDKLPEQFSLIGWSLGGLFATRLALETSTRVNCLLNITSSPYFIQALNWPGIQKSVLATFFLNLINNPQKTTQEFIALQIGKDSEQFTTTASFEGLKGGLTILSTWDIRKKISLLTMPTYYFFGKLDSIVSYKTMLQMQNNYPYCNYVLFKKGAHIPFISHENEFIEQLNLALEPKF